MAQHPEDDKAAEYWQCPLCGFDVKRGYIICAGCQAEVVYGLTRAEWQSIATVGAAAGGITGALLMLYLPMWLAETFGLNAIMGWGLGFYAVLPIGLMAAAAAYGFARIGDRHRRLRPPRFFARRS